MDDRIAEIRKALEANLNVNPNAAWQQQLLIREAAWAYVDLLDSDALIIRRDENGKWDDRLLTAAADRLDAARGAGLWVTTMTVMLDALASSQGVEP